MKSKDIADIIEFILKKDENLKLLILPEAQRSNFNICFYYNVDKNVNLIKEIETHLGKRFLVEENKYDYMNFVAVCKD